ncbi:HNH endonuclease [Achromobacter xylosoxidans]|uniref:HNH endonuclease n=1 Tax=Alcaligenes xylosoxydans xylosoxydans TaxID=85698 RepID=UPI0011DDB4BC|nr:HNH endonuclease [Achromobacter xylosoxidans]
MKQIPIAGGAVAVVDDQDFEMLSAFRWHLHNSGYPRCVLPVEQGLKKAYMHRMVMGGEVGDGRRVDHINGNPLDNRRANLRWCSMTENMRNRGATRANTSGFKGVTWDKQKRRWMAQIKVDKRQCFLGYFDDPAVAHQAYREASLAKFGEFSPYAVAQERKA